MQSGHAGVSQGSSVGHQVPDGCTTPAASIASNSGQDFNKPVSTASAGMPAPAQQYQSTGGPIVSSHPIIQQEQQISRSPITVQTAAYYPRNSVPPRSMQSMARNPIGAVVNQPGQQTSSQYGPMPTMVPLQPNFTSFPPTMVNPQFPQMYQQTAYSLAQYPIMANQRYSLNYNIPQTQYSIGYYPSYGISSYQSMPPQILPQSIPVQSQQQHSSNGEKATPLIDPKTGKNLVSVDKRSEDSSARPNTEKESENSDSNICLQLATQLVAFLNDSGSDIALKQPEFARIDTKYSHENEEMKMEETPIGELVDENFIDLQHVKGVSEVDITENRNLMHKEEVGGLYYRKDIDSNTINECESGVTKNVDFEAKTEDKKQNAFEVSVESSVPDTKESLKGEKFNFTSNVEKMVGFTETKQINNDKSLIDPCCSSSRQESVQPVVEGAKEELVLPSSKAEDCSVRPKREKESADFYRRNIAPPQSFLSMAGNPIRTVVNQPAQQPSFQYMVVPTKVPLQPNFTPFPPTIVNPEFPQTYQQTAYNPAQYPTMANQQNLWNYNTEPPQNLNGYFSPYGMPSYQTMSPQMLPQPIPAQLQQQPSKNGETATPLIDPKTGKNVVTVNKKAEDNSAHPNRSKESENSDSNICLQLTTRLAAFLNDSPCDVTFKQHEPVIAIVASLLLLLREKQRKGAAVSPVLPLPPVTTAAPGSVSRPVSERNPYPIPITDSEILNATPTADEHSYTTPQNDLSPSETPPASQSAGSEDKKNTVEPQENKIVLKYSYKEDQWSPLNPEGKKKYDREFLLQLQSHPVSLCKPNNLPNLNVIKDKAHIQKLTEVNRTPSSTVNSPPHDATVNRDSQGKGGKKSKKRNSLSVGQNIKLHESPNPWKPLHKCAIPLHEKDRLKRSVLGVLNKLTPQKFETLLAQLKSLLIDTEEKLSLVRDLVFEKAVYEPKFSAVYANLSKHLALIEVPVAGTSGTKVNFCRLLIRKCQKEFEQDRSDELEEKMKNLEAADPDQRKELQLEYNEEEKKNRYRKLGNIRFIGELFKLTMFIEPVMHEYIRRFLHQSDEESLEYLSLLLKTIGKELDDAKSSKNNDQMDIYFAQMKLIVATRITSSRVRFLLQDVIDLRINNWKPRREENNPKTIDEIHEEAEREAREQQQLCQNFTKKRKHTDGMGSSEDGLTSSSESNKSSNRMVNPSKLKLTKPDEVESILLRPSGRDLQSWGRGCSSGTKTTADSDKTAITNRFSDLTEQSLSSNFGERRGNQRSASSSHESSQVSIIAIRKKPPSTSKERENLFETVKGLTRASEAKAAEVQATAEVQAIGKAAITESLNGPQCNEDDMERKTKTLIDKFLDNNDSEEAIKCVTELASPNTVHKFINAAIYQVLEQSSQARYSLGQLLSSLLKKKIITFEQYKKGFAGFLEIINDYALGIPLIWDYMEEILEPIIEDIETPFQLLKEVLQPCIPSEKAGILVSSILHCAAKRKGTIKLGKVWRESGVQWTDIIGTDRNVAEFIEKHKLEFTVSPTKVNSQTQMPMDEMKKHLLSLLEKNAELEEVLDWVDVNVLNTSSQTFVRALVTAVHESCLLGSGTTWELNTSKLKSRIPLISRYISTNEKLHLQALYAVQALMNKLGQPSGLLHQIFDILYDDDVISFESLLEWEKSDDPNEAEGKGVAVHSVKSFFAWLREPEEETEEMYSV